MINRERVKQMFSHYRKRLKKYGLNDEKHQHLFRTTGSPCSCAACSGEKYNRKQKHKKRIDEEII